MPRRSKGARLHLKSARRNESGIVTHQTTWIIRDMGETSARVALKAKLKRLSES
jgi:hypothetical protein